MKTSQDEEEENTIIASKLEKYYWSRRFSMFEKRLLLILYRLRL